VWGTFIIFSNKNKQHIDMNSNEPNPKTVFQTPHKKAIAIKNKKMIKKTADKILVSTALLAYMMRTFYLL